MLDARSQGLLNDFDELTLEENKQGRQSNSISTGSATNVGLRAGRIIDRVVG